MPCLLLITQEDGDGKPEAHPPVPWIPNTPQGLAPPIFLTSSRETNLRMRGGSAEHRAGKSEWARLSFPLTRQGTMASPWEQSSRDKHHPPALNGVERGVQGRWWWKIHHPSYHPEKPTCREERNQCKTGAAFPLSSSLYLTSMGEAYDRLEWAVTWLPAPSCTPPLHPSPWPLHIYLSIHVYTRAHMHAHRERPVQFPRRIGREWQRKGRWGVGEEPVGRGKGLRCQEHSNQSQTKRTERIPHPTSQTPEDGGGHP